jgi:hypothetical protein
MSLPTKWLLIWLSWRCISGFLGPRRLAPLWLWYALSMLHSETVSFSSKNSDVLMSWKSEEKGKSGAETTGVGISFLHSVMFEM